MPCRRCGCPYYRHDPDSGIRKLGLMMTGGDYTNEAFRNCVCGHHYNYHY